MVRLTSKTEKINKRTNLNKQKPTRQRHYTLNSINKGHVLLFIWMAHPVVPWMKKYRFFQFLLESRVSYTSLSNDFLGRKL